MSSLSKIRKNSEKFKEDQIRKIQLDRYEKMTPKEIQETINNSLENQKRELDAKYNNELDKLYKTFCKEIKRNNKGIIETMSIEFIYELANQMEYWNLDKNNEDDIYVKESAKFRIKDIWSNSMDNINKYLNMPDSIPLINNSIYLVSLLVTSSAYQVQLANSPFSVK